VKKNLPARLMLCALLFFAVSVFAQVPQPFSSDYSLISNGKVIRKGKLYFSFPKWRMDVVDTENPVAALFSGPIIVDLNAKITYLLMSQRHSYIEFPTGDTSIFTMKDFNRDPCAIQKSATCKKLGTETINGRTCDKWEMTDPKLKGTLWIDQKLHFIIKTDSQGIISEFTNIKEGAQDPSLFKIPADYQKADFSSTGDGQRSH
jgi:Domain of unknown function (DUF4412)